MPDITQHESLDATLERLKRERDEADRRYNDALTALDRALPRERELPPLPIAFDEHQVTPLNESWNIAPAPPAGAGLKGRLAGFVWRTVGPYLQRQLTFNSLLVDHVNRNTAAAREAHRAAEAAAAAVREQFAALAQFHARLLLYLQQVTAYVDTKDRDTAGAHLVLNGAISGLSEDLSKRWESLAARERRYEAHAAALRSGHDELRGMVGVAQQAILTLKRELARVTTESTPNGQFQTSKAAETANSQRPTAKSDGSAFAAALDAYKYVGFEDQFRGSREAIRERFESYLPLFDGRSDVLDVGCGRGEFLDLLKARGITCRGIDLNHEMAELCRARGLDVAEADAVGYLSSIADESLGGLFAAQVVEHLEPEYLLRVLELAFHKLRPGGRLVLETLNPACWVAFFESYIRDITHAWPLHPETLKYLVVASGFTRADVEFRSPVPPEDRLQPIALPRGADAALADLVEAFNSNVEKLNARMFTYMDYAIVAGKSAVNASP